MAEKKPRKRNKALDGLASVRASGATAATFHPDGTLASVTFAPVEPAKLAPVEATAPDVAKEILASPKWPKTDVDALDDLPSYDEAN